ncbi:nuclear transport factor 2 family protein [Bradyrhizobium valentinum]
MARAVIFPEPAHFTMLLVKEGNDWVIAHHHSSLCPPPKQ